MLDQVFVSYTHAHKPDVAEVVDYLRERGLTVFFDADLKPGGVWRQELEDCIKGCEVFLVFVTKDILEKRNGPRSMSFVFEEIRLAKEAGIQRIYPIIVGRISIETDFPLLAEFNGLKVSDIKETVGSSVFRQHVKDLKAYIDAGGRAARQDLQPDRQAETVMWPTDGDHLIGRQALALSVMLLEGEQPFLIHDAAQMLQDRIEGELREMTDDEKNSQPRIFGGPGQSVLLESIGAHRMVPEVGESAGVQLVEFRQPGHAAALLEYLWSEQPQVRALFVKWLHEIFESQVNRGLALHLARGLSHLARFNLRGLEYEMLNRFVRPDISHNELAVLSELLAAAYDEPTNRPRVLGILKEIFEGSWLNSAAGSGLGRAMALEIALGPLAERTPDPAIQLLKDADLFLREPTPAGEFLRRIVLGGQLLQGGEQTAQGEPQVGFGINPDTEANVPEDAPNLADTEKTEIAPAEQDQPALKATEDEDTLKAPTARGTPTAYFLRALADWIDTPISEPSKLIERQLPMWIFLSTFERMPLFSEAETQRFSLEDLVFDIGQRRPMIMDKIVAGFRRASLARTLRGSNYSPAQHVNLVCRRFAQERKESDSTAKGDDDAFVEFLRRCYVAVQGAGKNREAHLLRGVSKFMTESEIAYITQPQED